MVTLPAEVVERYPRFSLYNSPYPAHDTGRAIDLYPGAGTDVGRSPVAGEVVDTATVGCPDRPYAVDRDHLVVIDTGDRLARVLHVDPAVDPGDAVAVGDPLGETVRSGFFGRWVDDHLHVEFREKGRDPYRASGSLPVGVDVSVTAAAWDGTGRVVETGETYVRLDEPAHPAPGERFAAVAADDGTPLDGGLAHYAGGGALAPPAGESVSLLGRRVGDARTRRGSDGEAVAADAESAAATEGVDLAPDPARADVAWRPIDVRANGERITGLSLFAAREQFGAKLVYPGHGFAVGDRIEVSIRPSDDPVRLGGR